jgi:beta-lactamase class A
MLRTIILVSALSFAMGCSGAPAGNGPGGQNTNVPNKVAAVPTPDADLQKQISAIAEEAKGKVGVYAVILETGESVGFNKNERFAMQSVVKLPISMAVLKMVEQDKLDLEEKIGVTKDDFVRPGMRSRIRDANPEGGELTVRELLRFAISESDGTASDVLQRLAGDARGVQSYIDSLGIVEMEVRRTHKEFGNDWQMQYENWASPEGAVALLTALHAGEGISAEHREVLLKFMTESNNPDKRLKGMLPPGTIVAHKTGTGGTQNGITSATNDIGIITLPNGDHMAIAVFVGDSSADEKTRESVIAKIARAVWEKWSGVKPAETKASEPAGNNIDFNLRHSVN